MKLPITLEILSADRLAMDQGATGPPLKVALIDDAGDRVAVNNHQVRFYIDGEKANGRVQTTGDEEIIYHWRDEDTENPGDYPCQFEVRHPGGQVIKAPSFSPATLSIHRGATK